MNTCVRFRQLILKNTGILMKDISVIKHYTGSFFVEIPGKKGKEVSAHCKDCAIVESIHTNEVNEK